MRVEDFGALLYERHHAELSPAGQIGTEDSMRADEWLDVALDMVTIGIKRGFLSDDEARQALAFARQGQFLKMSDHLAQQLDSYLALTAA